jgi:hypothetical protein
LAAAVFLFGVIWWNRFLPMQDYPQHLFMSVVASSYDDSSMGWSANFELRNSIGPYRGVFLAQNAIGNLVGPEAAGKVVATVYMLLMGLLAHCVYRRNSETGAGWGALLLFPLCLHPMYFYGFLNFTLALPLLLLAVLEMENLVKAQFRWQSACVYLLLVFSLFMLHPYVLLVQIVLACASVFMLARGREQFLRGTLYAVVGLIFLVGWAIRPPYPPVESFPSVRLT